MSKRIYVIRNIATEKEYRVDEDGMKAIEAQGWKNKYTVVNEIMVRDEKRTSFIPEEVAEASRSAADAEKEELKNEKLGRAARG